MEYPPLTSKWRVSATTGSSSSHVMVCIKPYHPYHLPSIAHDKKPTVPATTSDPSSLNVHLNDVPPGDDYFLLLFNSTHGGMYATSERFTVLSSSASPSSALASAATGVTTVTVSGAPDPTKLFATTLAGVPDGGVSPRFGASGTSVHALLAALFTVLIGCVFGTGMVTVS
jgi:hypothetical protein